VNDLAQGISSSFPKNEVSFVDVLVRSLAEDASRHEHPDKPHLSGSIHISGFELISSNVFSLLASSATILTAFNRYDLPNVIVELVNRIWRNLQEKLRFILWMLFTV
jgi:hypothetical protein